MRGDFYSQLHANVTFNEMLTMTVSMRDHMKRAIHDKHRDSNLFHQKMIRHGSIQGLLYWSNGAQSKIGLPDSRISVRISNIKVPLMDCFLNPNPTRQRADLPLDYLNHVLT